MSNKMGFKRLSLIKKSSLMVVSFALLSQFYSASVHASDIPPTVGSLSTGSQVLEKHYIPSSVFFYLTQKGMGLFKNNFYQLIQQQGAIEIEENTFSPMSFKAPIVKTEEIAQTPEQKKLVNTVRGFLVQWLNGLTLTNTHQFVIEIGETKYKTRIKKVSLNSEEQLLKELGKTDGAVFSLEFEGQRLDITSQKVRVFDILNQNFLPKFGLNEPIISLVPQNSAESVSMKIPFYVQIDSQTGLMKMEVLGLEHNLNEVNIDLKYKSVYTSDVKIIIQKKDEDGTSTSTELSLNMKNFSDLLDENRDRILAQVKTSILEFVKEKLPTIMNEKLNEYLHKELSFSHEVPIAKPPKINEDPKVQTEVAPLMMGHKITHLRQQNGLVVSLASYLEDINNPTLKPNLNKGMKKAPTLEYNAEADSILVINQALLYRMVALYQQRGYLDSMGLANCDGTKTELSIVGEPEFIPATEFYTNDPLETFLKVKTTVKVKAPEAVSYATKAGYFLVSSEAVIKLRKSFLKQEVEFRKNGKVYRRVIEDKTEVRVEAYFHKIIEESVNIDSASLSVIGKLGKLFGVVEKNKKQMVQDINNPKPECGPVKPILSNLPIPPAVYGIKFDILKMIFDKEGPLVLYLKYN